jgi:hypothetical protein
MAVLVEGISVIIRADRLEAVGGWDAFKALVPNETLCADGELVRVGFMAPSAVRNFIAELQNRGLDFSKAGPAADIVVADQQRGFTSACDWAEFGHIDWDRDPAKPVAAARLNGSRSNSLVTPDGWNYDQSLTNRFSFIATTSEHHSNAAPELTEDRGGPYSAAKRPGLLGRFFGR